MDKIVDFMFNLFYRSKNPLGYNKREAVVSVTMTVAVISTVFALQAWNFMWINLFNS